jgi:hypothetical protein
MDERQILTKKAREFHAVQQSNAGFDRKLM